jgi:hypothetical protein
MYVILPPPHCFIRCEQVLPGRLQSEREPPSMPPRRKVFNKGLRSSFVAPITNISENDYAISSLTDSTVANRAEGESGLKSGERCSVRPYDDSLDGKDGVRLHDDSLEGKLSQSREGH